jgi:hypothetical protein
MPGLVRNSIAALIVITLATVYAKADDKADIKASGKAFRDAMVAGDAATAKKHLVSDEKSEKFVNTLVELVAARKKLTDAAVAKFGEDGKSIVGQNRAPGPDMDGKFDDADIEVNGNTAIVTPKTGKPVTFKKDGGDWKIDFSEMAHQDQIERGLPIMGKMATVMKETAGEINDGKYDTVQAAKAGFHQKLAAAMGFPTGAPGRSPAGQP